MKTGRSLQELAAELERQSKSKKDYIADTRRLSFRADPTAGVVLEGVNGGMPLRSIAHQQMSATLGIHKAYYDKMLEQAPDLLAQNANHWLKTEPARKMVRTIDGQVRAVLSDSYGPRDNLDLANAVLPKLISLKARVESAEITENRFYLKAVSDRVSGTVKLNDVIQAGVVVSNSEVGHGYTQVEEMDYRLACLNGMIRASVVRRRHVDRKSGGDSLENAREYFRTETKQADDHAFFMKVRDTVGAMFDPRRFNARLDEYREAGQRKIEADPIKVVEVTAKKFGFNEGEKSSILTHLIQGGDLSSWGLANAVTRAAQDVESYDRSTEMEALGGEIIELKANEWRSIAATAA